MQNLGTHLVSDGCHPQRLATVQSTGQRAIRGPRARLALLFVPPAFLIAAVPYLARGAVENVDQSVSEVVIQAKRQAADEQITRQVEKTLTEDPWVFSEHVTVTTRDGVVRVEGVVQDTAELFRILDLARKIPGTRRVVDAMEILHNDPDGG